MSIIINGRKVKSIFVNGRAIKAIYKAGVTIWTNISTNISNLIKSCFASGSWNDTESWTDDLPWKD